MLFAERLEHDSTDGAPDPTEGYVEPEDRTSEKGKRDLLNSLLIEDTLGQQTSM